MLTRKLFNFTLILMGGGGAFRSPFSLIAYYFKNRAYNLYQYICKFIIFPVVFHGIIIFSEN